MFFDIIWLYLLFFYVLWCSLFFWFVLIFNDSNNLLIFYDVLWFVLFLFDCLWCSLIFFDFLWFSIIFFDFVFSLFFVGRSLIFFDCSTIIFDFLYLVFDFLWFSLIIFDFLWFYLVCPAYARGIRSAVRNLRLGGTGGVQGGYSKTIYVLLKRNTKDLRGPPRNAKAPHNNDSVIYGYCFWYVKKIFKST